MEEEALCDQQSMAEELANRTGDLQDAKDLVMALQEQLILKVSQR